MATDHSECYSLMPYTKAGAERRKNTHPVPCVDCGELCQPGTAYIEKSSTRGWIGFPINGKRPT